MPRILNAACMSRQAPVSRKVRRAAACAGLRILNGWVGEVVKAERTFFGLEDAKGRVKNFLGPGYLD